MADTKKSVTKKSNTGRKSNSGAKGSTRKNTSTSNRRRKRTPEEAGIITEIYIWVALAAAIILFLSNFGVCGVVGGWISYFMFGIFGVMAYVFPIILFVATAFVASNPGKKGVISKVAASGVIFVDLCVFSHMIMVGNGVKAGIVSLYLHCGENKTGGGLLGGNLCAFLVKCFGSVGAYIITILIFIIAMVILTGKSLMEWMRDYGLSAYDYARDDMEAIRENRTIEREKRARDRERAEREREERRKERERVRNLKLDQRADRGVDFGATTIASQGKPNKVEDVHEIDVNNITIEGLEPAYSGPVEMNEEDSGQYTYFEVESAKKHRKPQKADYDSPVKIDETSDENSDIEFTPKEKIIVSEEAKQAMSRKPYQTASQSKADDTSFVDAQALQDMPKQAEQQTGTGTFQVAKPKKKMRYSRPKLDLLNRNPGTASGTSKSELMDTAAKLQQILKQFGVNVTVTNVSKGPSVTRYELQPEMGTKVSKITSLADDIKLNLAAADIRIEAPIPGKAAVGIEVPNKGRDTVYIRDLIESKELRESKSKIAFAAGKDIAGRVVVADIAKMPHMLVAGTTGSGKSVFTNSIIMSILYRATPDEVKLIIIDPKVVEFGIYNGIPHLMTPVVTDPKKAAGALNWAVAEMSDRYKKFAATGTRDLKGYNDKIDAGDYEGDEKPEKLPQIVIIIDELADLMMVAAKDVEDAICRLAQLARAAGIHLIIATQRPSVDVVTGLIKANIPSRVALLVSSGTDSRTIIDMNGAEKLLGNGDMLFYPSGYVKPVRIQGAFVSDEEVQRTVNYLVEHSGEVEYNDNLETKMVADSEEGEEGGQDGRDAYFMEAARLVVEKQKGSTSMIQRTFRVGFNRAARIMEQLYDAGIVGQEETNKPRRVLMTIEDFETNFSGSQDR